MAHSLRQQRPALEVRIAAPEVAQVEIEAFKPHLLINDEGDNLEREASEGVSTRMEFGYSEGMDARIFTEGHAEQHENISTEILLGLVDEAEEWACGS